MTSRTLLSSLFSISSLCFVSTLFGLKRDFRTDLEHQRCELHTIALAHAQDDQHLLYLIPPYKKPCTHIHCSQCQHVWLEEFVFE